MDDRRGISQPVILYQVIIMPFVVGETIGSYRIVQQLGQGGMATVFKAYHPLLERYVALS